MRDGYDFKETFSDVPKCFWPWDQPGGRDAGLGRFQVLYQHTVKSLVMALYLVILWFWKFDLNEDLVTIVKALEK